MPIAEAMLSGLVAVSGSLTAVDEEDARLEGKLGLLLELVTVLDRRHIGTASGGGLVHRIITGWSPSNLLGSCIRPGTELISQLVVHNRLSTLQPGILESDFRSTAQSSSFCLPSFASGYVRLCSWI